VRARIDAHQLDLELVGRLMNFARNADCVFVTSDGRVVEPEIDATWMELMLSPAASFVQGPEAVLNRVRRRQEGS